jgi:hypothetical protein
MEIIAIEIIPSVVLPNVTLLSADSDITVLGNLNTVVAR